MMNNNRWPAALRDGAAALLILLFAIGWPWRFGTAPLGANACLQGDCVDGKGVFEWANGNRYEGEWVGGLREGVGVHVVRADGSRYEGEWQRGWYHGLGVLVASGGAHGSSRSSDGRTYFGAWSEGRRHGMGVESAADGGRYEGAWRHGVRHGMGKSATRGWLWGESVVSGLWAKGMLADARVAIGSADVRARETARSAMRAAQSANPACVEGDCANGMGVYAWPNGDRFEGAWSDGLRHGFGVHTTKADGSRYEGAWVGGAREGFGVWTALDGSATYAGVWRGDAREGLGLQLSTDGALRVAYAGGWKAGARDGVGVLTSFPKRKDGVGVLVFEGEWKSGMRHGVGRRTTPAGWIWSAAVATGAWRRDALVDPKRSIGDVVARAAEGAAAARGTARQAAEAAAKRALDAAERAAAGTRAGRGEGEQRPVIVVHLTDGAATYSGVSYGRLALLLTFTVGALWAAAAALCSKSRVEGELALAKAAQRVAEGRQRDAEVAQRHAERRLSVSPVNVVVGGGGSGPRRGDWDEAAAMHRHGDHQHSPLLDRDLTLSRFDFHQSSDLRRKFPVAACWEWQWSARVWKRYAPALSKQLREAYAEFCAHRGGSGGGESFSSVVKLLSTTYEVDFTRMVQINTADERSERAVRNRVAKKDERTAFAAATEASKRRGSMRAAPAPDLGDEPEWSASTPRTVLGESLTRYTLQSADVGAKARESREWNFAHGQFKRLTRGKALYSTCTAIDVYENPRLRARFRRQRDAFASCGKSTEEIWVFHGTSEANVASIMAGGFKVGGHDVALAHGALHGHGIYTAKGPDTPMDYAGVASSEYVILARALPGAIGVGAGEASCDCWEPEQDWAIFRSGSQLLPVYVVRFSTHEMD